MQIVKVKICGITNYEDAAAAVDMGADIIGFNLYSKSPRYVPIEKAAEIIKKLPAFPEVSLIFVNETRETIDNAIDKCLPNWVQFHGNEPQEFCDIFSDINVKIMKAIRVKKEGDIKQVDNYFTDAVLLDTYSPDKYGGTGENFDWGMVSSDINRRIFLAGGINPENAAAAVETGTYGIDVCSGVEESPGKKDHNKMKALFKNIEHLRA
jgi:phosphoribosylanthranilate isomerase